jgi:hypothetical protein
MKTKISRIMGVGLALLLVFSLAFALVPAKTEAAPMLWTPETSPGSAAAMCVGAFDINGMAVGPDGYTIYVIDNQAVGPCIYKSVNGGRTFATIYDITVANPAGFAAAAFLAVAVAPDNPNVVAIVDGLAAVAGANAAGQVYVSRDGGVNWVALPVTPDAGVGTNTTTSLAVGPARAAAAVLDGRDFMVTTADDGAAATVNADIFIIGQTLVWTAVGTAAAGASAFDYTSCAFSTGYIGDRVIVAVGSAAAGTSLLMINLGAAWGAATAAYIAPPGGAVLIQALPIDWTTAVALTSIQTSSIALPTTGFDPTTPGGQRVWVGMAAQGVGNTDVFRVDFTTVRKLGVAADVDINSISYSGDFNNGTLIAGASTLAAGAQMIQTWYTNDPGVAFPTWIGTAKSPTGTAGAIVACAPDFPTSKKVFAGTNDAATANNESALSVSYNGGVSFNQISLIDTVITGFSDAAVTPDGSTMFLSSWNAGAAPALESLWMGPAPATAGTWDRIRISPIDWGALGGAIVRLNPGYADAPVLFWGDVGAVGIQYSADGGSTFVPRNTLPVNITDLAVESATVIYAASGTTVYRSDSAAWNFNVGPVDAGIGPINMICMAPTYPLLPVPGNLLVGGAGGAVTWSLDSANPGSFAPPAASGLGTSTLMQVVADTNYADNAIIYAGSGTVGGGNGIYRWVIGTSTLWENIQGLANITAGNNGAITGMVATNGVLYAAWNTAAGASLSGVERTLAPTAAAGTMTWDRLDTGSAAATFVATPQSLKIDATASPTLYDIDTTTPALFSYADLMATATTTISVPASGSTITIDPVTGRAMPATLNWTPMGYATGLANTYQVLLYEASQGPAGGEIYVVALAGPGVNNPTVDIVPVGQATAADIGYNFVGGTSYGIMIRASNEVSGDAVLSNFCAPVTVNIEASQGIIQSPHAGPILLGPAPGAMDVPPDVGFSWAPLSGVTEYELIIATDAALTQPVAGTPVTLNTTAYGPVTLEYSTDYWYAVRATAPTSSVQSVGSFRTMISPEEAAPPVVVEQPTISPAWIWAVVIIGALLVIAVIVLIVRTRRA